MIKDIIDANKNVNATQIKLEKLKELFPGAFHGETVDLEYINKELKEVKFTKEGYELNFLGKSYAKLLAAMDTETVIVPDNEHNKKEENINSNNLYISADNLDALKHLVKSYWKKIKVIYIDPPYNTGSDGFVYADTFGFTKESLTEKLGLSDEEAERVVDMIDGESSSHSAWLTFMYPRLYLAKQLLADDGNIFVSINEHEQANLKLLLDEIFGENNMIAQFSWRKTSTPPSLSSSVRRKLEYIFCYAKTDTIALNGGLIDGGDAPLLNESNAVRKLTFKKESLILKIKDGCYKKGQYDRVFLVEDFEIKNGLAQNNLVLEGRFKWTQNTLDIETINGTDFWIKSDKFAIRYERKVDKIKPPSNSLTKEECGVGTNEDGQKELISIFGKKVFDYPKPISLIEYLINMNTRNDDYVLDFFSGSASTGASIINLGQNLEKNLKFILVQLPENLDKALNEKPNDEVLINAIAVCDEVNKPHTLDVIGMERLIRINKLANTLNPNVLGFKHFTVMEITKNTLNKLESFNKDALFTDKGILDEFGVETVLTTWMNTDGYGLSRMWKELKLFDYTAYQIDGTIYLINPNISEDAIKSLLEKYESDNFICNKIVIFGYSFTMSEIQSIKDNLKQVEGIRHITLDILVRY